MTKQTTTENEVAFVEAADYYFLTHGTQRERDVWNADVEDILKTIHCQRPVAWEDVVRRHPREFMMIKRVAKERMRAWRLTEGTMMYYGTYAKGMNRTYFGGRGGW